MIWRFLYFCLTFFVWLMGSIAMCVWPGKKTRQWLKQRLWPQPLEKQPDVWFHGVSLGETNLVLSVLSRFPEDKIPSVLVTTSTLAGMQNIIQKKPGCCIRFLPFDFPWSLNRFWSRVEPSDLFIAETELWPHLFNRVRRSGRSISLFNARFGKRTMAKCNHPLIQRCLSQVSWFLVRSAEEEANLEKMGVPRKQVFLTGNLKFDYAVPPPAEPELNMWLEQGPLVCFSSISNDEVPILAPIACQILDQFPELRLLWVPRHFDSLPQHLKDLAPLGPVKRTDGLQNAGKCLILDTVGELAGTYRSATLSLIGGSFNQRGGQNFLEALAAGCPTVVGPNMGNFESELKLALSSQAVLQVDSPQELKKVLQQLISEPDKRETLRLTSLAFMEENRGSLDRTVSRILDFLPNNEKSLNDQ